MYFSGVWPKGVSDRKKMFLTSCSKRHLPRNTAQPFPGERLPPPVPSTRDKTRRLSHDYASWYEEEYVPFPHFATNVIHTGSEPDQWNSEDLAPHIAFSTAFRQSEPGVFKKYDYSRCGNPTRNALERTLAATDNSQYAVTFSSGTAALSAIVHLLKVGDEIIATADLYGGTNTYFETIAVNSGLSFKLIDMADPEKVEQSLSRETRLVWIESPSNPVMRIVDIPAVCKVVKDYNSEILVVCDNTFTTPYFMRPLDLGVDIAHQSCTKYMSGHTDIVMGVAAMNNEKLYDRLKFLQINMGAVPSPFDCYQMIRSLKTLPVRMKEHMRSGLIIANFLEKHELVLKVNHPGLPSHPQHELFKEQSRGYTSVLSFYIKGNKQDLWTFFRNLKVFTLAASLGGVESIVSFPMVMTHAGIDEGVLRVAGITESLARLSVGLEDTEDLIADLDQALWSTRPFRKRGNTVVNGNYLRVPQF